MTFLEDITNALPNLDVQLFNKEGSGANPALQDMGFLGKLAYALKSTQDPQYAARYQQQQMNDKKMQQESQLAALAQLAATGDKSALAQMAAINPQAASVLAQFSQPKTKVQEIGGKLVSFDPSDPNAQPKVLFESGGTPLTEIAKLKADLDAGRIDKDTYDRKIAKEVAPTEKNYKQFQLQNAAYADRMVNAEDLLGKVENQSSMVNKTASALGSLPLVGGYLENVALTDEQQTFRNAANDWIRAKLRKESGAAIGVKEMEDEYKTYFPVPGDSKEVIKQKASLRKVATDSMIKQTSGAYDDMYAGQRPTDETTKKPTGTAPDATREQKLKRLEELRALKAARGKNG